MHCRLFSPMRIDLLGQPTDIPGLKCHEFGFKRPIQFAIIWNPSPEHCGKSNCSWSYDGVYLQNQSFWLNCTGWVKMPAGVSEAIGYFLPGVFQVLAWVWGFHLTVNVEVGSCILVGTFAVGMARRSCMSCRSGLITQKFFKCHTSAGFFFTRPVNHVIKPSSNCFSFLFTFC